MFDCCECCVMSGRGLCDELITRPEKSYQLWCVVACDLETSRMKRPWLALGRSATKKIWQPKDNFTVEVSKGFTRIRKRPDSLDAIYQYNEKDPKPSLSGHPTDFSQGFWRTWLLNPIHIFRGFAKRSCKSYTQNLRQIFLPVTSRNTIHEIWHCWIPLNLVLDALQLFFNWTNCNGHFSL
jgi:hypothetical protein